MPHVRPRPFRRLAALIALAAAALLAALALACGGGGPSTLVVLTHDSFDVSEGLIEQFEREHDAEVELIASGDANEVVNRAILNAGNPEGDVLFGVDNLGYGRAAAAGAFRAFE